MEIESHAHRLNPQDSPFVFTNVDATEFQEIEDFSEHTSPYLSPLKWLKNNSFVKINKEQRAKDKINTIDREANTSSTDHLLSKENKFIRFKVNDFLAHTHIQMLLVKLWKLWIELKWSSLPTNVITSKLPLEIYGQFIPLLSKGLGYYYHDDYYVTKKPEYSKKNIKFDRFSFDWISLVGEHLLSLKADQFELILRRAFQSITFMEKGKLQFL